MKPSQLLAELSKGRISPTYLFLGPEAYQRDLCRRALIERVLPEAERENGFTRHDLDSVSIREVLDDAKSFSLFAGERVIYIASAEAALPRGKAVADDDADVAALARYVADPMTGVVLVFESSRYAFDGDDKAKVERVRKFYSAITQQVEFTPLSVNEAAQVGRKLATAAKLRIAEPELEQLVELLDADAQRLSVEIEKLSLYVGAERAVTMDDVAMLAPNARASTIFKLVNAIGANHREQALDILNMLVQEGEYLPLALSFAGTQFRLALAAKEAKLSSATQIQGHFSKQGIGMWRARAEQVAQTAASFSAKQLMGALKRVHAADRALRSASPDDRIVLEQFVLTLAQA